MHTLVEEFGEFFVGIRLVVVQLLVHEDLEALEFTVPFVAEGIDIFGYGKDILIELIFHLLDKVSILELLVIFDFQESILDVHAEALEHAFIVFFVRLKIRFHVLADGLCMLVDLIDDEGLYFGFIDLLDELGIDLQGQIGELRFQLRELGRGVAVQ